MELSGVKCFFPAILIITLQWRVQYFEAIEAYKALEVGVPGVYEGFE